MVWLILALLLCVALAAAVVAVVAIPARREGREILTDRAEELVSTVTSKTEKVTEKVLRRDGSSAEAETETELEPKVTQHGRPIRRRAGDSGNSDSPAA
ncbi:hypothetical protein [Branchiibius sp. NY16-3462-2]|uniref:hypothetical protein n=1 Tax=Branchiibius sp. NY16-3462-2 TaxID=1807500 RepID=UPI000797F083|nr:hypothetical protein [Branchiibius sp. NY16-3462-2]KYH43286.1 hypothetical protein AZH51_13120 [Branchiibius sp. NY16-3462-2]